MSSNNIEDDNFNHNQHESSTGASLAGDSDDVFLDSMQSANEGMHMDTDTTGGDDDFDDFVGCSSTSEMGSGSPFLEVVNSIELDETMNGNNHKHLEGCDEKAKDSDDPFSNPSSYDVADTLTVSPSKQVLDGNDITNESTLVYAGSEVGDLSGFEKLSIETESANGTDGDPEVSFVSGGTVGDVISDLPITDNVVVDSENFHKGSNGGAGVDPITAQGANDKTGTLTNGLQDGLIGNGSSSPVVQGIETISQIAEVINSVDTDDFGDFGSFDHAPVPPGLNLTEETTTIADSTQNLDDVGGSDLPSTTEIRGTEESASKAADTNAHDIGDDDFGDFGDFDSVPHPTTINAGTQPDADTAANAGGAAGGDEDDFGDFGDFDSAGVATQIESGTDTAKSVPQKTNAEDEDEDFGDFDSAVPEKASVTAKVAATVGEDDDFGDFDSVEPAKTATNDAQVPQVSSNLAAANDVENTFVMRARSKWPVIFAKYSPTNDGLEENSTTSDSPEEVKLETILKSLESDRNESVESIGVSSTRLQVLFEQLHVPEPSPPHSIINGDAKGPYAHYIVPLFSVDRCLLSPSSTFYENKESSKREVDRPILPEAQTPSIQQFEQTKLPEKKTVPTPAPPPAGTVVALPPAPAARAIKVSSSTIPKSGPPKKESAAMEFLRQIPDLSFMLSSKLSLPGDRPSAAR